MPSSVLYLIKYQFLNYRNNDVTAKQNKPEFDRVVSFVFENSQISNALEESFRKESFQTLS